MPAQTTAPSLLRSVFRRAQDPSRLSTGSCLDFSGLWNLIREKGKLPKEPGLLLAVTFPRGRGLPQVMETWTEVCF